MIGYHEITALKWSDFNLEQRCYNAFLFWEPPVFEMSTHFSFTAAVKKKAHMYDIVALVVVLRRLAGTGAGAV